MKVRAFHAMLAAAAALAMVAASGASVHAQTGNEPPEQVINEVAQEFGGRYRDPQLDKYVASIGQLIVATTPMANQRFTVTVLNSPLVNAFSMPGGYVFVTRGLIALCNNEAELAGVLGHEIGHITAHHAEQRQRRSTWAQLGAVGAGVLGALFGSPTLGDVASQVVGTGSMAWVQKYSREQEYEADQLGVRSMSAAGYDPRAMATFLADLEAQSRLEAQLAGRPPGEEGFDMMADHPRTLDRVQRAAAEARGQQRSTELDRDIYLQKIDGILSGDDPENGVVRNRVFYHPALHFAFSVPPDFQVLNGAARVAAQGPGNAAFIFDRAPQPFDGSPEEYIARLWAPRGAQNIQRIDVNGMPAATAIAQAQTDGGATAQVQLVAIRFDPSTYYRFVFVMPANAPPQLAQEYQRTTFSFRRLSDAEVARIRPYRLRVLTVRPGDTVDSLARRIAFDTLQRERFLVLNGMAEGATLQPGQKVKILVEE